MIYTSYFAKARNLDRSKYIFCSIARYNPSWFEVDYHLIKLSPLPHILKGIKEEGWTTSDYMVAYWRQLAYDDPIDIFDAVKSLQDLSEEEGKDVLLLCYETPDQFCHRKLLTSLIRDVTGVNITELI